MQDKGVSVFCAKDSNDQLQALAAITQGYCPVVRIGWGSWDSSVGIVMGYGLRSRGSIPSRDKRFFSTPQCPDWLCALFLQAPLTNHNQAEEQALVTLP
jgi:hypothetical protein